VEAVAHGGERLNQCCEL